MFDSEALAKIQSMILIVIIVVAALGGVATYVLLGGEEEQSTEPIKIGCCADLDGFSGKAAWQAAILAAEQVNAEGGVLGRNFTIIAEDNDGETPPFSVDFATNAFIKLITVDDVDFVFFAFGGPISILTFQDYASQYKKIMFTGLSEEAAQRVLDDYEKYKYTFSMAMNETTVTWGHLQNFISCREYTGFNKIAFLWKGQGNEGMVDEVKANGFEVVYSATMPSNTIDFSSYFAQAEAAGAEILYSFIHGTAGIPFVKEYCDRQSPMILWGFITMAQESDFWGITEGKCEYTTNVGFPIVAGYPFTNKTLPTRDAYVERWNEDILSGAAAMYDFVRFVLPAAIELAGTTETDAVIEALETVEVEGSQMRAIRYAANHEPLIKMADLGVVCMFQWQDGVQVPVWPEWVMKEANATYMYPDWPGPWNK